MNENLKKLGLLIMNDEAVARKLEVCKTLEESFEAAKAIVGGYTADEYKTFLQALSSKVKEEETGALSDDALGSVAGGSFYDDFWCGFRQPIKAIGTIAKLFGL